MNLLRRAAGSFCCGLPWLMLAALLFGHTTEVRATDVLVDRVGPNALETGFWQFEVKRSPSTSPCTLTGTFAGCYRMYIDVQNASDQVITCSTTLTVGDNSIGGVTAHPEINRSIGARSAYPMSLTLEAGAYRTSRVTCLPQPPPSDGSSGGTTAAAPQTGQLAIEGNPTVSFASGDVSADITVPRIANRRTTRSGTLYLQLWATTTSGGNRGYQLGQTRLGEIPANMAFNNISDVISVNPPPPGTYFISLLLAEYPNLDSHVSRVNFVAKTFAGPVGGGTGAGIRNGTIGIEAPVRVQTLNDTSQVSFSVAAVRNRRATGTSAALSLKLYATDTPGGTSGYLIAQLPLGALQSGLAFLNVNQTVSAQAPPAGTYFLTVILTEAPNETSAIARVDLSGNLTVSAPLSSGGANSSGDDGGGGGAIDVLLLLGLIVLSLFAARGRGRASPLEKVLANSEASAATGAGMAEMA